MSAQEPPVTKFETLKLEWKFQFGLLDVADTFLVLGREILGHVGQRDLACRRPLVPLRWSPMPDWALPDTTADGSARTTSTDRGATRASVAPIQPTLVGAWMWTATA